MAEENPSTGIIEALPTAAPPVDTAPSPGTPVQLDATAPSAAPTTATKVEQAGEAPVTVQATAPTTPPPPKVSVSKVRIGATDLRNVLGRVTLTLAEPTSGIKVYIAENGGGMFIATGRGGGSVSTTPVIERGPLNDPAASPMLGDLSTVAAKAADIVAAAYAATQTTRDKP